MSTPPVKLDANLVGAWDAYLAGDYGFREAFCELLYRAGKMTRAQVDKEFP